MPCFPGRFLPRICRHFTETNLARPAFLRPASGHGVQGQGRVACPARGRDRHPACRSDRAAKPTVDREPRCYCVVESIANDPLDGSVLGSVERDRFASCRTRTASKQARPGSSGLPRDHAACACARRPAQPRRRSRLLPLPCARNGAAHSAGCDRPCRRCGDRRGPVWTCCRRRVWGTRRRASFAADGEQPCDRVRFPGDPGVSRDRRRPVGADDCDRHPGIRGWRRRCGSRCAEAAKVPVGPAREGGPSR